MGSVGIWFFPDWLAGGHGTTNVVKALAESVNTFFYYIGGGYHSFQGLGVVRIVQFLEQFGFGSHTGIDMPSENGGFLPTEAWKQKTKNEPWYIGDTYNLSIGQGDFLATPLQIANMTAAVANGGTLYQPHIVRSILNPMTNAITPVTPTIIRDGFIDPDHIEIIQLGMRQCVTSGSCRRLNTLPIAVAGKTGTAQWHSERPTHAWFTSFAPYNDPELVLTILIEEGGEGSRAAVPVAEDFYRWWTNYKNSL